MLARGGNVQLCHLFLGDPARRIDHHVTPRGVLRKGDEVADVGAATAQQRAQSVEAERKSTMGRSAEFEGTQEEAELLLRLLASEAKDLEDLVLEFLVVNTDGAAADLELRERGASSGIGTGTGAGTERVTNVCKQTIKQGRVWFEKNDEKNRRQKKQNTHCCCCPVTNLDTVDDQVIGIGADAAQVGLHEVPVFVLAGREGVVHRLHRQETTATKVG